MNESRPNQKSPFRPMMIVLALIVVVPLLLCGGVLTWLYGRQSIAAKELADRIETLRQDGQPFDNDSLEAFYKSLTSDKFTPRWVALREATTSEEFVKQSAKVPRLGNVNDVPSPGDPWPQEDEVVAFLQEHESLLKTIHELAEEELKSDQLPLRRPVEFAGFLSDLTDTQASRTFVRLIGLEFDVALRRGDGERVFRCIQACRGIHRSFSGEPFMVSQLLACAVGRETNHLIRRALREGMLDESQLVEIRANIPDFQQTYQTFQLAIRGERALALNALTDPDVWQQQSGDTPAAATLFTKLRSRDAIFYVNEMEKVQSFPGDNVKVFRKAAEDWGVKVKQVISNSSGMEMSDNAMSYGAMPMIERFAQVIARQAEHDHLARLAIAVQLFHDRIGHWPQNLAELDAIDVQPRMIASAGDEPFGYLVEEDRVVVWGIDRNAANEIPQTPPLVDSDYEENAAWVWPMPKE